MIEVERAVDRPTAARRFDRRVLVAVNLWDYGDPRRGPSPEAHFWLPALDATVRESIVFSYDRTVHAPQSLDVRLLEAVDRLRPDLVMFFPFRDDTSTATLAALRARTRTLAFFADDQWRFDDYSSRYATAYSVVVTTDPAAVPRYRALGGEPVLSQWAGRLVGPVRPPLEDEAEFRHDVSFVGGWNHYRGWFVDRLARHGVSVACFGAGWPNGRVGYAEMEDLFRTSRINLNLSNSRQWDARYVLSSPRRFVNNALTPKTAEQVKARHFEIALAGGFQLAGYAVGLEDWLRIGPEVVIYTGPDDCLQQLRQLLPDAERRHGVARRAWRRSLAEHTYERRIEDILAHVWPEEGRRGLDQASRTSRKSPQA